VRGARVIDDLSRSAGVSPIEADLCLIGAGAAGITIAREFAGSGIRVCLVESGGLEAEDETQRLYEGDNVGQLHCGMDVGRLRFFGGTTNHWGGRCTPLDEQDFVRRTWLPGSGWPISRAAIEPYYRRARELCGLGSDRPMQALLSELRVDLPELRSDWLNPRIWQYTPNNWSFGTVYREELRRAENILVLLHANLTRIIANARRNSVDCARVTALNGASCAIRAKCYVLCCGAIENARLLLSTAEDTYHALGNGSDLVGRFYMDHLRAKMAIVATSEAFPAIEDTFNFFFGRDGTQYQIGMVLAAAAQQEQELLNCSATLEYEGDPTSGITAGQAIWRALQQGAWPDSVGEKVWRVVRDIDLVASDVRRRVVAGRHPLLPLKAATVILEMEQAPNPESRVTLSSDRDVLGMRKVRVNWQLTDLERRSARKFAMFVATELTRLQLGRCRVASWVAEPSADWASHISEMYHQTGTTRMSASPQEGVVDASCKVHGVENLYVAGSSVFPTGGHANPTFTIVALALRLSDHLKATFS
jgi:choline dehydrogenase-like flavoprotein